MLKIQELRIAKNLTQKELAEKIGVRNYIVANWEQGRTEPSLQDLIDLANFFECSIDYLVGRENDFGQITVMRELTEKNEQILNLIDGLPEEKKKIILSLLQIL